MATLNELLTQYAAYNVQRGSRTGIRLPTGIQGPDGWVPCTQSPAGCGEIVGLTAIAGTVYWMPGGTGAPSGGGGGGTVTVVTGTGGTDPSFGEFRRKAIEDYNNEVLRELTVLLASLDRTSAAYASAHRALESALSPVVAAEIARLDTINDAAAFAPTEAAALARIDSTAEDAFRRWQASTATAADGSVQQATVVTQVVASGAGTGASTDRAMTATDATLSLTTLPGAGTAASWYASIRAKFLRAPDELRADLASLDQLRVLAGASDHPALSQLGAVDTSLQNLLADWTQAAVTAAQIDEALTRDGPIGGDTVARILSLAGVVVSFFARKATAEALLDAIAQQVLTPEQYTTWKQSHPLGGGGVDWLPWLLGAGIVVTALVLRRRR